MLYNCIRLKCDWRVLGGTLFYKKQALKLMSIFGTWIGTYVDVSLYKIMLSNVIFQMTVYTYLTFCALKFTYTAL